MVTKRKLGPWLSRSLHGPHRLKARTATERRAVVRHYGLHEHYYASYQRRPNGNGFWIAVVRDSKLCGTERCFQLRWRQGL